MKKFLILPILLVGCLCNAPPVTAAAVERAYKVCSSVGTPAAIKYSSSTCVERNLLGGYCDRYINSYEATCSDGTEIIYGESAE